MYEVISVKRNGGAKLDFRRGARPGRLSSKQTREKPSTTSRLFIAYFSIFWDQRINIFSNYHGNRTWRGPIMG